MGGFFWFVFLSAQENEQRPMGVGKSRPLPGVPLKVPFRKNTALPAGNAFFETVWFLTFCRVIKLLQKPCLTVISAGIAF
jgi:hypothetical protein